MKRRGYRVPRRKLMLFPFMDIFFVVTVFFLAISVIRLGLASPGGKWASEMRISQTDYSSGNASNGGPMTASYLTPDDGNGGKAHMLIQLISADKATYRFYDYSCVDRLRASGNGGTLQTSELSLDELRSAVRNFLSSLADWQTQNIFAVILCPKDARYEDVRRLREKLDSTAVAVRANVHSGAGPYLYYSLLVGNDVDTCATGEERQSDMAILKIVTDHQ
jgi:hypothetical protein